MFKILLPLVAGKPEAIVERIGPEIPEGEGTLLIAEDDPHVRSVAERILGRNGFRVLMASDGEVAQSLIKQHQSEIRMAILDVIMPKRNGREVFDYIKANHPSIRVLFCSGYSVEMLPPETAPDVDLALINKPYTAEELLEQVHRLL